MEIGLLGPLEVTVEGRTITMSGAVQRGLLGLLAIEPGVVVPADRLADALYGDSPPAKVANALQSQVSRLRRLLGPDVLIGRHPGYALAVEGDRVDSVRFERLVREARDAHVAGDAGGACERFRRALLLWRGPALVDLLDVEVARAEASRLEALRETAFEERIAVELELGRHHEVLGELQVAVAEHPLREALRGHLMLALYRSGRQADALAAYQDGRRLLADELGLDPGPELQQLEAAILRQDPSLAPPPTIPATPAPAPDRPVPARVPAAPTTFVGREGAVRDVGGLLGAHRVVTVTGPGGAGKTRLALEFAARQEIDDGVWFVDLAVVSDPDEVAPAVARTFGIEASRLLEHLAGRRPLIVLDNCEHVLDAVAPLVESLLASSAGLRLLATSREPLNIGGEVQWPLPPLPLDAAVRLFADRAGAVQPAFEGADDVVAAICRRLDGMPLAIELAAARVKAFSVSDIAARLDDRFRLLTSGSRTALPRHQTLRALVDWSYDLLFDDQRVLFELLSVFPGGFALDTVERMAEHAGLDPDDALDLLAHLVDKSLVHVDDRRGSARYRMLETLRQYGHDRLADTGRLGAARRWQAEWCLTLAERAVDHLLGPESAAWLDRLVDVEIDNVRAAMAWAMEEGDAELSVRLATAYGRPMWERGHQREGRAWLEGALDLPGAADLPPHLGVLALVWLSAIASDHDRPLARDAAERAVTIAGDAGRELLAPAQVMLAQALIDAGDLEGVPALLADAAPHLTGWQRGWCEEVACYAALRGADLPEAEAACRRSLEHYEAMQNPWSAGRMRHKLAFVAELRGDYPGAVEQYERSIALARPLAVHEIIAVRVGQLGRVLELAGDAGRAAELAVEADELLAWLAGVDTSGTIARRRSDLALARGELTDARAWYEAAGRGDGVAYVDSRLAFLTAAVD